MTQLVLPLNTDLSIPDGLPPWLTAFIQQAVDEHRTLAANGAHHAVSARVALLRSLLDAATRYLDAEIGIDEAAAATGRHPETIRRAVRKGALPDRRAAPRGRHRLRRGDLARLAHSSAEPYDPVADAQDIARRRRPL